jgi:hypothetical protein
MRVVESRVVYENRWMRVHEDRTLREDGTPGLYGWIEKRPSALIVPIEDGHVWLVEQFRHPVGARFWEFPQGSWEDVESSDPESLARGELAEETGLRAMSLELLGRLYFAYGISNQPVDVWRATGAMRLPSPLGTWRTPAGEGGGNRSRSGVSDHTGLRPAAWVAGNPLTTRLRALLRHPRPEDDRCRAARRTSRPKDPRKRRSIRSPSTSSTTSPSAQTQFPPPRTGTPESNETLSRRRATSVRNLVAPHLQKSAGPVGRGAIDPVGDNQTEAGRRMNRRVVTRIRQPKP